MLNKMDQLSGIGAIVISIDVDWSAEYDCGIF